MDIRAAGQRLINEVDRYLEYARNGIDPANHALEATARSAIAARRERVRANYAHLAEAGIPMRGEQRSGTYIADAIIRRPSPLPMANEPSRTSPMPLDPVLAENVFEHVLGVLRGVGRAMERSPEAFGHLDEEARRDHLLSALNSHYKATDKQRHSTSVAKRICSSDGKIGTRAWRGAGRQARPAL